MIAATSEGRQVPREGAVLVSARHQPAGVGPLPPPASQLLKEWQRDVGLAVVPVHKPTPAECYGCVDWFPF
jgi:hypothetical protein